MTPKEIVEGGCQCGALRYRLTGEPLTLYLCHCLACQKQSASAFGMSLRVRRDDFTLCAGSVRLWHTRADSGTPKLAAFCDQCGTRLYNCRDASSPTLNIKAGTLDDPARYRPVGHLWAQRAQPWFSFDDGLLRYDGQPENYDELCARWTESRRSN